MMLSTPRYMLCLVLSVAHCLEALHTPSIHTDAHVLNGGFDHIMLFAMAKVGSETMKASLNATYVPGTLTSYPPIVKVHYAKVAKDYMQKLPPGSNTLVISIVRDPFDQQKSLFFRLLEDGFYPGLKLGQASVAQLVEEFPKRIGPSAFSDHWRTLAELTGVDVMEQQFDFDGHQLLAHNDATNVSVLVFSVSLNSSGSPDYGYPPDYRYPPPDYSFNVSASSLLSPSRDSAPPLPLHHRHLLYNVFAHSFSAQAVRAERLVPASSSTADMLCCTLCLDAAPRVGLQKSEAAVGCTRI
ncbi:unnamed protein product [Prorocentrum cordatum]|uniref:Sulfotransferase domain-containing protein n=1 Tax=Prorocentrum cordatum TaxID=2364126 RepID=A0ABN9W5N3_9DINO|nr:unnamed protein product [Polarella glacialis]